MEQSGLWSQTSTLSTGFSLLLCDLPTVQILGQYQVVHRAAWGRTLCKASLSTFPILVWMHEHLESALEGLRPCAKKRLPYGGSMKGHGMEPIWLWNTGTVSGARAQFP